MGGLFGDLPAPSGAQQQPQQQQQHDEFDLSKLYRKEAEEVAEDVADEDEEEEEEEEEEDMPEPEPVHMHLRKRVREPEPEEPENQEQQVQPSSSNQPGSSFAPGDVDQVTAALQKIASHITTKFAKASPLLRQLLDGDKLLPHHRAPVFTAIKAAFADPQACTTPELRKEYARLLAAIERRRELFGRGERAQLEVFRLLGGVQNEMFTDDNFVFNKVIARLKEIVADLPPADDIDDQVFFKVLDPSHELDNDPDAPPPPPPRPAVAAPDPEPVKPDPEPVKPDPELDPFGLDSLLAAEAPKKKAKHKGQPEGGEQLQQQQQQQGEADGGGGSSISHCWGPRLCLGHKRQALLDCAQTAKLCHKHAWAKTSVELFIDHLAQHADRFCTGQRMEIDGLAQWVRGQRQARKAGPSAKEAARDMTSFEKARAEWASQTWISKRGKMGGGADAKANNWLG